MSWDNPHAWRDSYDAWKTREPDWYYDEEPEDDREWPFVHQPRMTRKQEAAQRALGNRAARVAVELGHVRTYLRSAARSTATADNLKSYARGMLADIRRFRTTYGPTISALSFEVPF